jgi:hypothetical protein
MNRNSLVPVLEHLEARTLLATCHVTRLGDFGAGADAGGGHSRGDLRYCINKANTEPGADTILFSRTGTIRLNSALPDLEDVLAITGPGPSLVTIDAQNRDRVFSIEMGAFIQITGLKLTNGQSQNREFGGAIDNRGNLTLQDCSISRNTASEFGGGIYNEGTLWIANSSISDNLARIGDNIRTWGGGIFNATGGLLVIQNSTVNNNHIEPGFSTIALGGGIANLGTAAVVRSTIRNNTAHTQADTTLAGAGGGIYNGGELRVDSSLILSNITEGDAYGLGGGIANGGVWGLAGGEVTIVNSTISNNIAYSLYYDGADARGGGISTGAGGTLTIQNSTIWSNKTISDQQGTERGGGISNVGPEAGSELHMSNTIVAGNLAKTSGPDFFGGLSSSGYNLIANDDGGEGFAPTDILDANPNLGPLQDNGGPTLTMALLPGSPAIDAGDPNPADPPMWDQRGPGFPRIVNGRLDIGAFEVQATGLVGKNAGIAAPLIPSPVHGASRGAVIGPALTPDAPVSRYDPAPFTGLLGVKFEPRLLLSAQAASARPANGPELFGRLADIFLPFGAESVASLFDKRGIP